MADFKDMGDYRNRITQETFGFLKALTWDEMQDMVAYIIDQGWVPGIEHEHPAEAGGHYWTMWKLPMFGTNDPAPVLEELEACHRAYPDDHVRLVGFDDYTQSLGTAFVVYQGRG